MERPKTQKSRGGGAFYTGDRDPFSSFSGAERRLANPAFRCEHLDNIFTLMMEEVDASMDAIAAREGEVVHWDIEATALAMNLVVKALIGSTLDGDIERFSEAAQLGLAHARRLGKNPFYKYTQHLTGAKRRFDAENAFLGELIDGFTLLERFEALEQRPFWHIVTLSILAHHSPSSRERGRFRARARARRARRDR